MSVLSDKEIYHRIFSEQSEERRLVISPLLDIKGQIAISSVDLRLGTHFIVQRQANVSHIDPADPNMVGGREAVELTLESRIVVPIGEHFVLHPNQFALGGTLEYIKMASDLSGYLIGKSSWGRLGLIVATAVGIHPSYRGIITLELRNLGNVPFYLRPGLRIAQIFFHTTEGELSDPDRQSFYAGSTVPGSRYRSLDKDYEITQNIKGMA